MKNILIVDDEDMVRDFLCRAVSLCGHNPYNAKNGVEALDIFKKEPCINVVILDINMPGMNGFDVASRLKSLKPDINIIISSATLMQDDEEVLRKLGIKHILTKPYSLTTLQEVIGVL